MGYWIVILVLCTLLALSIFAIWYSFFKKRDMEKFRLSVFSVLIVLVMSIYFAIDIPNALGGGEKLYTDKRPEMLPMMSLHIVYAGGQRFIDFSGYNPDKYEQDAKICIIYTKFTKTILKIEKVK